jgi:hypothetical protein
MRWRFTRIRDNNDFPPYIGTGSEDYFGDVRGIGYLSGIDHVIVN